ncbi:sulfite oxidase [Ornithinimicrobium humiphilum]|uniref:DMSO/TMAO reductase YedYZ molybdopterin-dependent catalytic subunit n=1 Tax=Ornithinimicrobium humiphilum TaxID=125288 RepID=A0A543KMH6_9MICO|nr:molybdopterin-dependent oxidoreductase [Ornithinimicrobium humiphilum]TQM96282.1 DMSO/TMAO reductase YedYZ molybdopterin-dependent catalytic subunit [Ornithinimicrobium humiphilum]
MGTSTVPRRTAAALPPERRTPGPAAAALCGVAATTATLGVAELLAGLLLRLTGTAGTPSPLLAVGGTFVDRTPPWLKDWAVATFGTADKLVLGVGMGVTLLVVGALVGVLGRRSPSAATAVFVLVGLVGVAAVASRPGSAWTDVLPTLLGLLVGTWVLRWGLQRLAAEAAPGGGAPSEVDPSLLVEEPGAPSRRGVLRAVAGVGALGVLGVVAGQALARTGRAARDVVAALGLPVPTRTVTVPPAALSTVPGHTPFVTPTDDFYRIDTALFVPRVDAAGWRLRVTGLVEREVEIDLEELLAQEHVEAMVTLTCVSNSVGGGLAGNAVWTGWPVRDLLARAGVRPEADMVLSRSVDGFTAGTPLEVLTDDRDALVAVAMNGEPLPPEHGYPVRLVVPGLYGYVSATKWVTELKVTRFDADEGYWTPRGWSERGPIKTASRIDVPRGGSVEPAADGTVTVAGVAWAQHRGITRVEVRVDDGEWADAELLAEPTVDAWRLWRWAWPAEPGDHVLTVRATDGDGEVQTDRVAAPAPDGASGWHTVRVEVA